LREASGKVPEAVEAHRQELRHGKQVVAAFPNLVPYLPVLASSRATKRSAGREGPRCRSPGPRPHSGVE
jgi:hypothetical protein